MYPYIEVWWIKIYFVWVGIVICVFLYLFLIYKFSKKYQLDFWKYFSVFWVVVLSTYILWTYFWYIFEYKNFLPLSLNDVLYLLSPFGFKFNFIWLSLGFLIAHLYFLKRVKIFSEKLKRIDIIFSATMISLFVLWFFLVLGDNFIWLPTDSVLGVSALINCPDLNCSKLLLYSKVYPVGLFLSIVALFSLLIVLFLRLFIRKLHWIGIFWFIIFLLLINFVFIFENYPRYLVVLISEKYSVRLDIKNWWTLILILFLFVYIIKVYNESDR